MLKFYSILIGENPEITKHYQPASKRKIALYANCLMVPVILWFINSYLLVRHVLEGGVIAALLTALIAAFLIFIIERAIIMSNGGRAIFWFRVFLGLIIASLGSISMDEVIFKNDIDNQVAIYKQKAIESAGSSKEKEFLNEITKQEAIVNQKDEELKQARKGAFDEAGGTAGSGIRGAYKIANFKLNIASKVETGYNKENDRLSVLRNSLETEKANAKFKAESDFNGNALLLRIRAMFDLIAQDGFMLGVYVLFTLFLFCLEFLVVVIKMSSTVSIDEELEKAREELLRAKTKKTLGRSEIFFNPESLVASVRHAETAMKNRPASIFN
jgi:hypothetical protein